MHSPKLFIFLGLLLAVSAQDTLITDAVANGNCGGNCPSGNCPDCKCGTAPAYYSKVDACRMWNGWSQGCCECIISHESAENLHAQLHDSDGSDDIGLWQVNSLNWGACNGGKAPCDLNANFNCARTVFQWGGNTWKYWSTCGMCGCCNSA